MSKTIDGLRSIALGMLLLCAAALTACDGEDTPTQAPPLAAAITAQPTDQNVVAGTAATFSVVASNASGYQWQSSTDGGANFTNVSAATSATHTTAASTLPDSGTQYRVVVAGAGAGVGNSVTSSAAVLTVLPAAVVPRFAYVANANDNSVSVYAVDAVTGQLRARGHVAAGASPISVSVDPSGKFAYVANLGSANVSVYTIDASTGALAAGTPVPAGRGPFFVTTTGVLE